MRLTLELMGNPQLHLNSAPLKISRRAVMGLLAYLAVNIGNATRRHTRESLSALFWPEYNHAKALANLRHTLWEVSQSVGNGWIIAEHEAVYLEPGADIVLDVAQYRSLLLEATKQSNSAHRVTLLEKAVNLYRGPFMNGFSLNSATRFNEWLSQEAEDLKREMLSALSILVEDYLVLNQESSAVSYAHRLVKLDPFNEAAQRQLMQLYAITNQRPAAIKQYQKLEKLLRKEINLDTQPETRALYKKIRKGELKPTSQEKEPFNSERAAPKHNLPLQITTFIGREREKEEIGVLVAHNRLVTLIGIGGIGKTRLALQVGESMLDRYPDGVWFIPLDSLTDEELAAQWVASFFGIVASPVQTIVEAFVSVLRPKTMLLILDSLEHVMEAGIPLIEALLKNCPNVKLLVTSRVVLGLEGECVYSVPPLAIPADSDIQWADAITEYEALHLFAERSRLVSPNFEITKENFPIISEICNHLDGIPLAIEFAAARVDMFHVEEIVKQLNDSFDRLGKGRRSASPRHQTLRASINWSWDLLTSSEQRFMRRLSVFAGGWTLDAAQSVCECENLELIVALGRKSLIVVDQDAHYESRYRFHNMVRKYTLEKLLEAGEETIIRDRHLEYFLNMCRRFELELHAVNKFLLLEQLYVERDNFRAAIQWAATTNVGAGLYLSGRLKAFWESSTLPEEKRWLLMI